MSAGTPRERKISISQILGLGEDVRVQNPKIQQTDGDTPRWYIRPYIDVIDADSGQIKPKQERIYLGDCSEMSKRDAIREKNRILARINRRQYVVQAQIQFGDFLDTYLNQYARKPENLSTSTLGKYECHIRNHIRPAFGALCMAEVTTQRIDALLSAKAKGGMAYATRLDLRNIICGIFTQAAKWGYWREANPALLVNVGKARTVREKRKLTTEQTILLLAALPDDVALICKVALFCQLRISEVMGLQWRHVDLKRGTVSIEQRFYRGDLDDVKTERSKRVRPLGYLADDLKRLKPRDAQRDAFVFSVRTHVGDWRKPGECRDDRDINQHFLRPAAQALGLYYSGFGFHSFRREGITAMAEQADAIQAMRAAGHTKMDTTLLYGLEDAQRQEIAVRAMQEKLFGLVAGKAQ